MFPMTVVKQSRRAKSSSGGKEYHLVLISSPSDRSKALVIKRWGKAGKWGAMDVMTGSYDQVRREYDEKWREKFNGEYREVVKDETKTVHDEVELRIALGPQYVATMGASNLQFLLPGADTKGVRDPDNPEFEKRADGTWRKKERPPRIIPDPEPTLEEQIAANPMWGMF